MGYTHYWRHSSVIDDTKWKAIATDVESIVSAAKQRGIDLRDWDGESGEPLVDGDKISLNGDGDDSHEVEGTVEP